MTAATGGVSVAVMPTGIAHVAGVRRCGSPWTCPVCAPVVREHRALDIDAGLARWLASGGGAEFASFTLPHDQGDSLKRSLGTIRKAMRRVVQGRAWVELRDSLGIVGQIKAVEITHGQHGWHPHIHCAIVTDEPLGAAQREQLRWYLYDVWSRSVVADGWRTPSMSHGVDVRPIDTAEAIGGYLTKVVEGWGAGHELARADIKSARRVGSRSPFQILDDFLATGDVEDLALWHEYEQATYNVRALTWSPRLRKAWALGEELSDEEAAALNPEDAEPVVVVGYTCEQWDGFVHAGVVGLVLDEVELWAVHRTGPPPCGGVVLVTT